MQELFEALAAIESVFCGHETCGLCGKTGVQYQCQRDKDSNAYYKAVCLACGAEFRFGVRRDGGGLFPQLKDQSGALKPNGGWSKWEPRESQNGGGARGGYQRDPGY